MTLLCSSCGAETDRLGYRYCRACHAAYMREWRKTHPISEEQRYRHSARALARVYTERGYLKREPCAHCLADGAERHHADYSRPLDVVWLCRPCHLTHHRNEKRKRLQTSASRESGLTMADLARKYAAPGLAEAA